jgi:hypothetical protein
MEDEAQDQYRRQKVSTINAISIGLAVLILLLACSELLYIVLYRRNRAG